MTWFFPVPYLYIHFHFTIYSSFIIQSFLNYMRFVPGYLLAMLSNFFCTLSVFSLVIGFLLFIHSQFLFLKNNSNHGIKFIILSELQFVGLISNWLISTDGHDIRILHFNSMYLQHKLMLLPIPFFLVIQII